MKLLFKVFIASTIALATAFTASNLPFNNHVYAEGSQNIRIGVYDNYPKIYRDEAGNIKGFWAEVTNAIAKKENWNVTYVYGTFDQGLARLNNGQIDMMVDVGVSPERQQIYDFNNEYVISGWASVFTRNGINVNSFLDLSNKKIAVMRSDIHYTGPNGIKSVLTSFGVQATFVEVDTYADVFKMLDNSQADAGIVNGDFGSTNENKYNVVRTDILFDPIQLKYAMPKNAAKNPYLISTLDSNLISMKQNQNSAYYQALNNYFGRSNQTVNMLPKWFYGILLSAGTLLIISAAVVLAMRKYQSMLKSEIQKRIGQIKDNEEKYSAVVNQAQDAIAIIQDEKIIFANKAIQILGYSEKEMIGKNITDLIAPEESKMVEGFYRNRIAGDAIVPIYETKLARKDGSLVEVEISSGIINYSGEPAVLVMVRDISQRKKMQADIKLQNSILSAELEASIHGVLIVDKLGNIILYNKNFVDLWQVPKEALDTGNQRVVLNSVIHLAKDPQEFLEKVDYLYKHKSKEDRSEIQLVDGRILDRYTSPLYVDKKVYVGRVWFFQDITEQKDHAAKLAQLERAKQEFVSIAAHQLRAPVTAIMNASKIMHDYEPRNLTEAQNKLIDMITRGADQMNELVSFLLTMTRAETGAMTLVPTPVNLGRLTNEIIRDLGSTLNSKTMKIKVTKKPNKLPPIFVDKNALTQVIVNLLSNAIDYSPVSSDISVSIVLNKDLVEFSVKDGGIGIPSEDQDKIFDKFYRTDKAKEVTRTGTGLGLPLAKSIVESWDGRIWVESEENKGSTFYFTIPIATNSQVPADRVTAIKTIRPAKKRSKAVK